VASCHDDPTSALSRRLDEVVTMLRSALERAPLGADRLISLCSGDAPRVHGLWRSSAGHRCHRLSGELDPEPPTPPPRTCARSEASSVVRPGDASDPKSSLTCARRCAAARRIFGNIADSDVQRAHLDCARNLPARRDDIWTRHRRAPDLTPSIANGSLMPVANPRHSAPRTRQLCRRSERYRNATTPAQLPQRSSTFRDDLL